LTTILLSCHSIYYIKDTFRTLEKNVDRPVEARFPSNTVALPSDKPFEWKLPEADIADLLPSPPRWIDITEDFALRDINHVSVTDPKLFAGSDRLDIDLRLLGEEHYSFPLPGAKLLSPFGGRRKSHAGVDLKTFANDSIRAAFDGIVRMAKEYAGYGNVIVVRHYNGLETLYSHNSKHLVKQGSLVKAGQPIALVGRTGRATTEHLHFETRVNGRPFNPEYVFDLMEERLHDNILVCVWRENRMEVSAVRHFPS
jgi:murein DD-endopeptidase MepM/ murein hydrolase activator NlpD